jgi:DNA-binding transcriptional ArsR family regulator
MSDDGADSAGIPPEDAFEAIGNETRIQILHSLGEAEDALAFSELYDRLDVRDSSQFNYHLDKLVGHFVRKRDGEYELSKAGERVVEAVLSGAVTEAPVVEATEIEEYCHHCDAPISVRYRRERVEMFCTECRGTFGVEHRDGADDSAAIGGFLGALSLPPAGVRGRTPREMFRTAWTWGNLELLAAASGICPRCAATVDRSLDVCETHDSTDELCEACHNRYAVSFSVECTTCPFETWSSSALGLVADTEMLSFLTDHDRNPISPSSIGAVDRVHENYEEVVHSVDPVEARLTFSVDGDELALTVDEDFESDGSASGG